MIGTCSGWMQAVQPNGDVVVAWATSESSASVRAQRLDAALGLIGPVIQVAGPIADSSSIVSADLDALGRFGIAWSQSTTVSARRGLLDAPPQSDLNVDGFGDLILQNSSGDVAAWLMNNYTIQSGAIIGSTPLEVMGTGAFNLDAARDLVLQSASGDVVIWNMQNFNILSATVVATVPAGWRVRGIGDFDGDLRSDILLQNTISGDVAVWLMNGASIRLGAIVAGVPPAWEVRAVADTNGDGRSDIVLQNRDSRDVAVWLMAPNGYDIQTGAIVNSLAPGWVVREGAAR